MIFQFVNELICNEDRKITHAQVVSNERFNLTMSAKVVKIEDLKAIHSDKNNVCDFGIDEGLLTGDTSLNIKEISSKLSSSIEGTTRDMKPLTDNIYDLFSDIVNEDGWYIDELGRNDVEVLEYATKFIPKFSGTTMTVYLPNKVDGEWKSNKLIYSDNGILKTNNFMFMVPQSSREKFSKYNLEVVKSYTVANVPFIILEYTGKVPIYAYIGNDFILYPSIVNRYVYMSEMYNMYYANAKFIKDMFAMKEETEEKPKYQGSPKNSRYTHSYVYFEPNFKRITRAQRDTYAKYVIEDIFQGLGSGWGQAELLEFIKGLGLKEVERMNFLHIMEIVLENSNDMVALVSKCENEMEYYEKLKFRCDNVLYALRACMYVFPTSYNLTKVLRGSDVPTSTFIRKQS